MLGRVPLPSPFIGPSRYPTERGEGGCFGQHFNDPHIIIFVIYFSYMENLPDTIKIALESICLKLDQLAIKLQQMEDRLVQLEKKGN